MFLTNQPSFDCSSDYRPPPQGPGLSNVFRELNPDPMLTTPAYDYLTLKSKNSYSVWFPERDEA